MDSKLRNMTEGKPMKQIFMLALPLMFGNAFQLMYTMVDAIVVGRGVGVDALAALGSADWLNWLVLSLATGFAQGFSILFAQNFGADDHKALRKSVGNSIVLSVLIAAAVTVISLFAAKPVLRLMNTPEAIIGNAVSYLYIIFAGIMVVMAYNFAASLLRALGDGRTPLVAMVIASVINIILDLVFVLVFSWGIIGAAVATVIAQIFSFIFCLIRILNIDFLKLSPDDLKLDGKLCAKLIGLGAPVALQNAIIAVGGIVVQTVINGFGVVFVAGITATNKFYGLIELAAIAFGYSMTTYMGQNMGAGKLDRIKKGMTAGAVLAASVSVIVSAVVFIFGKPMISMFVSSNADNYDEVIRIGFTYLCVMGAFLSVLYLLHVYRSALQGLGDTFMPMMSGVAELVMRIAIALTLPQIIGEWGIFATEVFAWVGATILLIVSFYIKIRKYTKNGLPK